MPREYPGVLSYARNSVSSSLEGEIVAYILACLTQDRVQLKKSLDIDNCKAGYSVPQR
jgi:hypothetical protein